MMLCGGVASYTPATAGGGLLALSPPTSKSPPPQNNRAGELGPLPSQGVLLTQYTVFHSILCHYALRVKGALEGKNPTRKNHTQESHVWCGSLLVSALLSVDMSVTF